MSLVTVLCVGHVCLVHEYSVQYSTTVSIHQCMPIYTYMYQGVTYISTVPKYIITPRIHTHTRLHTCELPHHLLSYYANLPLNSSVFTRTVLSPPAHQTQPKEKSLGLACSLTALRWSQTPSPLATALTPHSILRDA